jgi:uncharacterized protein with von Willebrand factor type A (vWA) domain
MLTVRYTAWDGTQRLRLTADDLFEKLSEVLSHTDDLQQALDALLRQGFEQDGVDVMGLDELLDRVREAMRERYRDVNLRGAETELRERLGEAIDAERDAIDGRTPADAESRRARLEHLPPRVSDALEALRDYEFLDGDAAERIADLLEEADQIRAFETFARRYGDWFQGPNPLSFEEALELMAEMERWRELEDQLASGRFDALDPEALRELLGAEALQSLQMLQVMQAMLLDAGYLTQREGRLQLSPRGIRKVGELALRDIYQGLLKDRTGAHATDHRGLTQPKPEATLPYRYGDPLDLDLVRTLKKALARSPAVPLRLVPDDFEVFESEHASTTSTVLLLDMSWSMSWEGRFAAAKKVALAMEHLVRSKYPRDYLGIVGFYTRAVELKLKDLPEASWNMGDPFTNLQDGLRLAGDLLSRHPSQNQHVIVITDGQPTAYFRAGRLHCEWPLSFGGISLRAAQETLKEVERITRRGVTINTFMLDDSPSLRAFVERMTRINKGRALYTRPDRLGQYLLVDYIGKKRKRV